MPKLYDTCDKCLAVPFCNWYSGKIAPRGLSFCNMHDRLYKTLALSEMPKKYLRANLSNCIIDAKNEAVIEKVKPILENIAEEVDGGLNLFIYGNGTGVGKTYTASMVLNHFMYRTCGDRFNFEDPLALYIDYCKLIDDLRYLDDDTGIRERFDVIMNVPLLLLDDVGTGTMSDFSREQTFILLNHRLNNELSTITTCNMTLRDLSDPKMLGKRNVSRLLSKSMVVEMTGGDRRMKELRT